MSLLVAVTGRNNEKLINRLRLALPDQNITEWREGADVSDVEFVLAWNAPSQMWGELPRLKGISSYGAGVDSLLSAPLPNVPVARIVDPQLAGNMSEYVLHAIGLFKLRWLQYIDNQLSQTWKPRRVNSANTVGILGLGQLGAHVGQSLARHGYTVRGWSTSQKSIESIACYAGAQLHEMLDGLDYLVCLLPLTEATRGILDRKLFDKLPNHAVLINVARGDHLIEHDLIDALNNEQLAGAVLDVFSQEPLPSEHLFWQHPKVVVTPHISAVTSVDTAVAQIADNYLRAINNQPLNNQVEMSRGY